MILYVIICRSLSSAQANVSVKGGHALRLGFDYTRISVVMRSSFYL